EVRAWSTPAYFSLSKGVVNYRRTDTLFGSTLQVASWGTVNLVDESVRLTLGIPGYSLRKILNATFIPDDYYLLIPVSGTLDNVGVDQKRLAPRVAALVARKEGGLPGGLVG